MGPYSVNISLRSFSLVYMLRPNTPTTLLGVGSYCVHVCEERERVTKWDKVSEMKNDHSEDSLHKKFHVVTYSVLSFRKNYRRINHRPTVHKYMKHVTYLQVTKLWSAYALLPTGTSTLPSTGFVYGKVKEIQIRMFLPNWYTILQKAIQCMFQCCTHASLANPVPRHSTTSVGQWRTTAGSSTTIWTVPLPSPTIGRPRATGNETKWKEMINNPNVFMIHICMHSQQQIKNFHKTENKSNYPKVLPWRVTYRDLLGPEGDQITEIAR